MRFPMLLGLLCLFAGPVFAQQEPEARNAKDFRAAHRDLQGLPHADYSRKFQELVQEALHLVDEAPETTRSEEILHWIVSQPDSVRDATQAAQLLSKHHVTSPRSIRALLRFSQRPTAWTPQLFEHFDRANKASKDYWIIEVCNALHDKSLLELADEVQASNNVKVFEARLGKLLTNQLASADLTRFENDLAHDLSIVANEHGRRQIGGATVQDLAAGMLFAVRHLRIGKTINNLSGKSVDGSEISLESHKNKVVLIDFWATWCAPCLAVLPEFKQANVQFDPNRFVLIGVSADRNQKPLTAAIERHGINWPVIHDRQNELQTQWQAFNLPYYYVLDANHVVRYRGNDHHLATAVAAQQLAR